MFLNKLRSIKKSKGFTLIELLVVISIISILVAVGIVSYRRTNLLSRDSRRKADIQQIRQALETYRSENGVYPDDATWEADIVPDYISEIPTDPKNGFYRYESGSIPITTYTICAYLELETDTATCAATCGSASEVCNYEVINP